MKKIYISLLSILCAGSSFAQTVYTFNKWNTPAEYLKNDFEGSILGTDWTQIDTTGQTTYPWAYTSYLSSKYVKVTNSASSAAKLATVNWFVSPVINLSASTNPVLVFKSAAGTSSTNLEVYATTNPYTTGTKPNMANWTKITGAVLSSGSYAWASSGELSLSAFKAAGVRIAFVHKGTASTWTTWELDDILVTEAGATKVTGWFGSKTSIAPSAVTQAVSGTANVDTAAEITNTTSTAFRLTTKPFSVVAGDIYSIKYKVKGSGDIQTGLYTGNTGTGYVTAAYYNGIYQPSGFWSFTDYVKADITTANAEISLWIKNTATADNITIDEVVVTLVTNPAQTKTISEIQNTTNAYGDSPENDKYRTTAGIVTAIAMPKNYNNYTAKQGRGLFIQNGTGAWSGLFVGVPDTTVLATYAVGDSISVTGVIREIDKCTKLVSVVALSKVTTGNAVPKPFFTTLTAFGKEEMEGVLVQVAKVACSVAPVVSSSSYNEWTANDSAAAKTAIIDDICYVSTATLSAKYDVTGVVDYSYGGSAGYRYTINPRSAADITAPTGFVKNIASTKTKIYPNPATNLITINGEGTINQVRAFDLLGKEVLIVNSSSEKLTVDISNLNAGIYLLQVKQGNEILTSKLIKE